MSKEIVPFERIAKSIRWIRGHKVLLDSDLALLYGVATKVLNQAVKRNRERFPDDFMFQLNADETGFLRSQFRTLEKGRRTNWSQIVTSSEKHRGKRGDPGSDPTVDVPARKGTPRDRLSCAREGASLPGA